MTTMPTAQSTGPQGRHRTSRRRDGRPEALASWERPALAAVLVVAALLYGWGMGHAAIHPYYSAAIRSMASTWRAFFFGGLDPSGSITLDKLPGAFWPEAVSVWIFGPHTWAVALPQVVEGVLTVWLLHRIVRVWAGKLAALIAALTLTLTPVTVVLNRATIPDTALTLLLVAAAGALQKALRTERLAPLITCGVWVGLAFQTKMLQAWLVLPVFAVVYQLAATGTPLRRALRLLLTGAVALGVSCSWALLAWITPAAHRPYVDGTSNNNPFSLVFGYNGLSRFSDDDTAFGAVSGTAASRTSGNTGWGMLVNHTVGPQIAWFLPLAVLAAVLGVVWQAREPRTDPLRAGFLLWGGWLAVHAVVFSVSNGNHPYYTAVIAPAVAALAGGGLALFRSVYDTGGRRRVWLPTALLLTVLWALVLDVPTLFASWLLLPAVGLAACSVVGLWTGGSRVTSGMFQGSVAAGIAATLLLPAGWSAAALDPLYAGASTSPTAGPVGKAYRSAVHNRSALRRVELDRPSTRDTTLLDYLAEHRHGEKYLVATQAAYPAERLLRARSEPILVMGGFTGKTPFPTAQQLGALVASHQLRYALLTPLRPTTPATTWVKSHCTRIRSGAYGWRTRGSFLLYDCRVQA
ncbi:ArnT family glycosyltransferase [Streptomyces sp. NBC_00557]|uniref:ArnT family glycosyltransferase n=1 Tax=Streptomyces sp. NBC_00557 TaxID=2975776 RepID=UPI002E82011A|nr:glycosyltransferase family 39 protein [Streptomyces sp. NBC_00557]WUC39083.1 glycosyltransferase family 39 protein [Streptomyces sp. NBC_00557]